MSLTGLPGLTHMHSDQTPIPMDRLAAPARRALTSAGYATLEQLAEIPEDEIAALHGMGRNALEKLRLTLEEHHLTFANDN